MPGRIDETRPFQPLNIAVLTVSDTRGPAEDGSGDLLVERLTRDGQDVHLSPKAFDLLVLLITRAPAVVDKSEIRTHLWPGVHVVDANISNLITEIRAAIAPASLIRTVHGVGYAFTGYPEPPTMERPTFRSAFSSSRPVHCFSA